MPSFVLLLISPITWMWKAFALIKLWSWFLVPAGVPRLGFVTAMGLVLVVGLLTPTRVEDEAMTAERAVKIALTGFFLPAFGLFFGWALHLFTA